MDRDSRAQQQDWQVVKAVLLRQFPVQASGLLAASCVTLWLAPRGPSLATGALIGGGWMVANCAALAWVGIRALKKGATRPARYAVGLLATMLGSLAAGALVAMLARPSLLGLVIGFSLVLVMFVLSLCKVKAKTHVSHVG